jgi:hydroxylysine kinase
VSTEEAVAGVVARGFGLRGTISRLESEVDETFRIDSADGRPFLIKVTRPGEAEEAVSFQAGLLRHVQRAAPDLPVPRLRLTADGASYVMPRGGPLAGRSVRVITFLPGQPLRAVPSSRSLREQIGRNLAVLGRALRGYDHPAAHRQLLWDIQRAGGLRPMADAVDPPDRRQVLLAEIDRFETSVAPVLGRLRARRWCTTTSTPTTSWSGRTACR